MQPPSGNLAQPNGNGYGGQFYDQYDPSSSVQEVNQDYPSNFDPQIGINQPNFGLPNMGDYQQNWIPENSGPLGSLPVWTEEGQQPMLSNNNEWNAPPVQFENVGGVQELPSAPWSPCAGGPIGPAFPAVTQKPPILPQQPPIYDQSPPIYDQPPLIYDQAPPIYDQSPPLYDQFDPQPMVPPCTSGLPCGGPHAFQV